MKARPVVLVVIIALGVAAFALYRARQTLAWWTVEPALTGDSLGPYRVKVPSALPPRFAFTTDGNAEKAVGQFGFDPLDVTLLVMPLGVAVPEDAVAAHLSELLAGFPGGAVLDVDGRAPRIVYDKDLDEAGWLHTRSMLFGSSVARVDVRVHPDAPERWRDAAVEIAESLRAEGDGSVKGLAAAMFDVASAPCFGGDLVACDFAAERAKEIGKDKEGAELLRTAIGKAPPMEGLWANAAQTLGKLTPEQLVKGGATAAMKDAQTLESVLALHRLLGELEMRARAYAKAFAAYKDCWRYDVSFACAEGLAKAAPHAAKTDGPSPEELKQLGGQMDARFGDEPRGLIAAAQLASTAGAFDEAKARVTRVLDNKPDEDLHRAATSVQLVQPNLKPITCPAGATLKSTVVMNAFTEQFCERNDGTRHGLARTLVSDGRPLREITFTDDAPGPPERFWWENGMLQKETWLGDDGTIRARGFDPVGRVVEEARKDSERAPSMPPELPKNMPPMKELIP